MGATSDDLMDIARAGAERMEIADNRVAYPSFSDVEEQCAAEYDELLRSTPAAYGFQCAGPRPANGVTRPAFSL